LRAIVQVAPREGGARDTVAAKMADVMDRLFDKEDNESRPHQGCWCFGKTPMQTFLDAMPMTKEKMIAA
jgi:hypothetical protein